MGKTGRRTMDREDDGVMQSCGKAVAGPTGEYEKDRKQTDMKRKRVNDGRGRVEAKREK